MANTIGTRTHAPQPQTTTESFFGRIGRAIKETLNPPSVPVRGPAGPDRYSGTPVSVASVRRNQSLIAGFGAEGPSARRATGVPVSDAQLVSFLDELGGTPTRRA